jgi:hypothetical protein
VERDVIVEGGGRGMWRPLGGGHKSLERKEREREGERERSLLTIK